MTEPGQSFAVCVYCASSANIDPEFAEWASALGRAIAKRKWTLVYGAGSTGLMGAVADGALGAGGTVIGVIPRFMMDREWNHPHIGETIVTENMHTRKQRMLDRGHVFVTLPGGTGTLEEVSECLSFKRLGLHDRPVIFANWKGFYDPFIEQLDRILAEGYLGEGFEGLYQSCPDLDSLLDTIENPIEWKNPLY